MEGLGPCGTVTMTETPPLLENNTSIIAKAAMEETRAQNNSVVRRASVHNTYLGKLSIWICLQLMFNKLTNLDVPEVEVQRSKTKDGEQRRHLGRG